MKKVFSMLFLIVIVFNFISCNRVNSNTSISSIYESVQTKDELISKNIDLLSQIEVLKGSLKKYEDDKTSMFTSNDPEEMLFQSDLRIYEKYPDIGLLQHSMGITNRTDEISKIVLYKTSNTSKKVTITDKSILNNYDEIKIDYMFSSERVLGKFDSCIYEMYYGDTKVVLTVEDSNIISIPQYKGKYFVTQSKINLLAIAFLDYPQNYPEETLIGKMLSSGIMYDEINKVPYFTEYNISSFVYSFNGAQKTLVSNTDLKNAKVIGKLTFYYFGQKINMTVYSEYVLITDGDKKVCYKMTNEAITEMLFTMSVP